MSTSTSTPTLITAADRSVKTLQATIAQLMKVSADLTTLGAIVETQSDDIQQNDSRLANIDAEFELKQRTAAANLNLAVLENEEHTMQVLMAKRNLATITADDLTTLHSDLLTAKSGNENAIREAVGAAARNVEANWERKLNAVENAHAVATATLTAETASKDERIAFLNTEIASLRKQVDAERLTRLEIARADAGRQGVVVNAGK